MLLLSWKFNFKKIHVSSFVNLFLVSLKVENKIRLENFIFQLPLMSLRYDLMQIREQTFPDYGSWGAIHTCTCCCQGNYLGLALTAAKLVAAVYRLF